MMNVDEEAPKRMCLEKLGMNITAAESLVKYFPDVIHKELEDIYTAWLDNRGVSNRKIEGIVSIAELMEVRRENFLTVLKYVNRLYDAGSGGDWGLRFWAFPVITSQVKYTPVFCTTARFAQ